MFLSHIDVSLSLTLSKSNKKMSLGEEFKKNDARDLSDAELRNWDFILWGKNLCWGSTVTFEYYKDHSKNM